MEDGPPEFPQDFSCPVVLGNPRGGPEPLPELVLCHADIHPGNLLISPDGPIYIVDWDSPALALSEKDLALIGGCYAWSSPHDETFFYQGYGAAKINPRALAYYRYERIVQDIAEFCKQLLLTNEGGEDREQSFQYFAHHMTSTDGILKSAVSR